MNARVTFGLCWFASFSVCLEYVQRTASKKKKKQSFGYRLRERCTNSNSNVIDFLFRCRQQSIVHTRHAQVMDFVRLAHASAKKDGKDQIVEPWIKTHCNACQTAAVMVHSIWILKLAIVNRNGVVTIVLKVMNFPILRTIKNLLKI